MTIQPQEHATQVSVYSTMRDSEEDSLNALRLASWQARYPHDVVEIPATKEPPSWPAKLSSRQKSAEIVPIKRGRA